MNLSVRDPPHPSFHMCSIRSARESSSSSSLSSASSPLLASGSKAWLVGLYLISTSCDCSASCRKEINDEILGLTGSNSSARSSPSGNGMIRSTNSRYIVSASLRCSSPSVLWYFSQAFCTLARVSLAYFSVIANWISNGTLVFCWANPFKASRTFASVGMLFGFLLSRLARTWAKSQYLILCRNVNACRAPASSNRDRTRRA